ncbi:MAG: serine/threonine protein kinase [Mycoplasmataceae bacterium]|nr:serine/threonine protein kinase [Mycoplasmataceae bacterium]
MSSNSSQTKFTKIQFQPNDIVLRKYQIVNRLGAGGMSSIVYKALDTTIKENDFLANKDNKYVAIKVINRDETWKEAEWIKIHDECVTSQRVSNKKNIVNTYEVDKMNNGNTIIIVMQYIDGISLHAHLEKVGSLNVRESIFYFSKILEGIKELHSFNEKIIHRDLKPENIMLTKDLMHVKIIDFGISSVVIESSLNDKQIITNEESIFGTYPYISPDLKTMSRIPKNERDKYISIQCDFFSLGIIFYEMLMGEKPFKSADENDQGIMDLPLKYDMMCISDINPNIPIAIENIIFRCIASKDNDLKFRYQSINQIIADLKAYTDDIQKASFAKLLKPKNERTFQLNKTFNVQEQKLKEKFYERHWFYWLVFVIAAIVIILIIILSILHEL